MRNTSARVHILVCVWSMFSGCFPCIAQILTSENHCPQATDSIILCAIPYQIMADSGEHCVWDFSMKGLSQDGLQGVYSAADMQDTIRFCKHWLRCRYKYQTIGDTLYCIGYENSNMRMMYTKPEKILAFPFGYKDMLQSIFEGQGEYAHNGEFCIQGKTAVRGDAKGRLLLPDNVVIDSVLRIHTQRQYVQAGIDTIRTQWNVYQWYSKDCRYPIVETAHCQSIRANDSTEWALAVYYPQENVEPCLEVAKPKQMPLMQRITNIEMLPNPVKDQLYLNYTLVGDAEVSYSLHYNGGACMYRSVAEQQEAGEYQRCIDMSGYPMGTYVLYIYTDEQVVSKNILKL